MFSVGSPRRRGIRVASSLSLIRTPTSLVWSTKGSSPLRQRARIMVSGLFLGVRPGDQYLAVITIITATFILRPIRILTAMLRKVTLSSATHISFQCFQLVPTRLTLFSLDHMPLRPSTSKFIPELFMESDVNKGDVCFCLFWISSISHSFLINSCLTCLTNRYSF